MQTRCQNAVKRECHASEGMTDRCFLWSHECIFSQKWFTQASQHISPSIGAGGVTQRSRWHMSTQRRSTVREKWRSRRDQDGRSSVRLTQRSGSANPGHGARLSRASHPSSQSIHRRPTVILFVQINNEIAAAPHGGTQRVVIAAFQAGSDGLCGRLARLHSDLVCVCNFPQA